MSNTRNLITPLSPKEILVRSQELASLTREIDKKKQAAKEAASLAREEIKGLESKQQEIATNIQTKSEKRDVPVRWHREGDFMRCYRLDFGEVIEERQVTNAERQETLEKIWKQVETAPKSEEKGEPVDVAKEVELDVYLLKTIRDSNTHLLTDEDVKRLLERELIADAGGLLEITELGAQLLDAADGGLPKADEASEGEEGTDDPSPWGAN